MTRHSTIGPIIQSVLPNGSNQLRLSTGATEAMSCPPDWRDPPLFPIDMFAVAGHLCKQGGSIAYFEPDLNEKPSGNGHFTLTRDDRTLADRVARHWCHDRAKLRSDDGSVPANEEAESAKDAILAMPMEVADLWHELIACWDEPLPAPPEEEDEIEPLKWWKPALMLTMIADMACSRVLKKKHVVRGQDEDVAQSEMATQFEDWIRTAYLVREQKAEQEGKEFVPPASLTLMVDTAVVCVLPKMRVAPVGATMRNVSRNLSLLPGRGEVRCYWENMSNESAPSEDDATLDILLIPEPRKLNANDFVPEDNGPRSARENRKDKWNWDYFELKQTWIDTPVKRAQFLLDCKRLLIAAKKETRCVNAVVLPEYALDYKLFEQLCSVLKVLEPKLEFVISGSSDNCYGHTGNHVLTKTWDDQQNPEFSSVKSRRKHHRWRMDRNQVETYGLSSVLNPKIRNWWEKTPLGRRRLIFHRFRPASAFSVLICEELARSDPCHEILRAVAPNLIFALLLDGPQMKSRWPAQYAANLADDPGSSVLTFTSFGLIDRSIRQGHFSNPSRQIAMWKDDSGQFVEIDMPSGNGPRGVLLSLWSDHVLDITLTGKRSQERAWRYSAHFPIFADTFD